jgi:hypothetical protein
MSDNNFVCRSVLICDEVREEAGGKQIIIGTYAGVILLPFLPFIGRITLRFEVKANESHFEHVECTILRPNGSIFSHETKPLDVRYPEFPTSIVFPLIGLNFEHAGEYTVLLAMDGTPQIAGNFSIITLENVPQKG